MKRVAKIFYGVLIFLFSIGFLYYIGNTIVHIILEYKERTQEEIFIGYGLSRIWTELYGKEYSIAFMVLAIIVLFVVAWCIFTFYRKQLSKPTLIMGMAGFLVSVIYMIIWITISYGPPSSKIWFVIFTGYLIVSVVLMIKDMKKIEEIENN